MLLCAVYGQKLATLQDTLTERVRKLTDHVRFFNPADHTQGHEEKNWHAYYFLRASCDFRFEVRPQGTFTKNEHYPCIFLAFRRFKMVGKSDLQTITGHVLVPYFPLASKCMIPKHVRAVCVKCSAIVLESHLARTTLKSHARSNIRFSYGWWAAWKLVARATCSISTIHFQTLRKHYVIYGMATGNKSADPVRAKHARRDVRLALHNDCGPTKDGQLE